MIALAALAIVQAAPTQIEPQATIIALAFEPSRMFEPESSDIVRIQYLGDDYALPVYAIAIKLQCQPAGQSCKKALTARMVRAPGATTARRPRWAGGAVVAAARKADARTAIEVSAVLERLKLDWMEADVGGCPAAAQLLADASSISWVPRETLVLAKPVPKFVKIPFHFDRVTVIFSNDHSRQAYFSGAIDADLPSGWAVRLAAALEPCWRPATAPPPWRRALTRPPPAVPASPSPPP